MPSSSGEKGKNQKLIQKLIQSTELLNDIHSRGEVCASTGQTRKPNVVELKEVFDGCRPAEEKNLERSQSGDIFSLGCYFYEVITGGEHPFGKPDDRTGFIANNLSDLTGCEDAKLRKLIARMVCHDSTKRPTRADLVDHPCLWNENRVENYLTTFAENIDETSEKSETLKRQVLFSPNSVVKSVQEILLDIKVPSYFSHEIPKTLIDDFVCAGKERNCFKCMSNVS